MRKGGKEGGEGGEEGGEVQHITSEARELHVVVIT